MVSQTGSYSDSYDVIIAGGGLAGLTAAILLSSADKKVLVIEKYTYPFHKVCGEYISGEVIPFLRKIGFEPDEYKASRINRIRISTPAGKNIYPAGKVDAFGLSRYVFDHALYKIALQQGAEFLLQSRVTDIQFENNGFSVLTNTGKQFRSNFVIGSYGKRDGLDKKLNRSFISKHTGYMGVKYHVKLDYPPDEIGLDNFSNGYCGIVKIEEDKYNLCYLYRRSNDYTFKNVRSLEEDILFQNPVLKKIFSEAHFIFPEAEVINEISFAKKNVIENHVFMCGDTAGLITPLCGNGMSMAIHSAFMLSQRLLSCGLLSQKTVASNDRIKLEKQYVHDWQKQFRQRLFWGRTIQAAFGNPQLSGAIIQMLHNIPPLEKYLINSTRGNTFI